MGNLRCCGNWFKDGLADVIQDSDTEFVAEDEQKDNDKGEDQEGNTSISDTNRTLHVTVHESAKDDDNDVQDKKTMIPVMLWTVLLKVKMIPWKTVIGISLQGI